jgi:hypothetical protein
VWEQREAGKPGTGVAAPGTLGSADVSVRGRLLIFKGSVAALPERWVETQQEWRDSIPYRMPSREQKEKVQAGGVRFAPNAEPDMTYGLTIVPPWKDGGTLHSNFPEHLEHGDVGYGILRHHNKRPYPWRIAADGRSADYEVESPELPGVIVRASAVAKGDGAHLTLRITNGGNRRLKRVKPLLCFWNAKLTGFPTRNSDNFEHTYVVVDNKPIPLAGIATANPSATAKVAYVRGCSQHDCDKFAQSRGGLIDRDIDRAFDCGDGEGWEEKTRHRLCAGQEHPVKQVHPLRSRRPVLWNHRARRLGGSNWRGLLHRQADRGDCASLSTPLTLEDVQRWIQKVAGIIRAP